MEMVYKQVGSQLLSLSTTFHVFFFQFIFVLLARYVRMRDFKEQLKQTPVVYKTLKICYFFKVIYFS